MTWRPWSWLTRALWRQDRARDAETEMRFHFDMEIEAGIRRGLSRREAIRLALVRAGSIQESMDAIRHRSRLRWAHGAGSDLRHAWTSLRRRPGFLVLAGGTLAAVVAVNTLVFTILDGVLLRPLPYPEPDRLVRVFEASTSQPKFPLSQYNYVEDKRLNTTLDGIALYTGADMQLMHGDQPEQVAAVAITDDFFPTLGVSPAQGRNFLASELLDAARVVILGHTFWKTRFDADPSIVGSTIRLNRESWTVIGITPVGFQHVGGSYRSPLQGDTVDIWRPLAMDNLERSPGCAKGCHYTNAIARLAPGVSIDTAQQDLARISNELAREFPDFYNGTSARLEPLSEEVVGNSATTVLLIAVAGGLVLLVACINVAGLSISRVLARRRELAIRQALGSSGWQVTRAVVSENVVLGTLAGTLGLVFTAILLPALHAILPPNFPRLHEIGFHWPAAVFALVAAVGTSTVAGVMAAYQRTPEGPALALGDDGPRSSASARSGRLRGVLVAAEIALACVLCVAAALLLRSSMALGERDNGFVLDHVLTFQVSLSGSTYDSTQRGIFFAEAARRIRETPGVVAAGFTTSVPWTGYDENSGFSIEGYTPSPGESLSARYQAADEGFVEALGWRLLEGRGLAAGDGPGAPYVIIVNRALARRYFEPGQAIGSALNVFGERRRIVGVVGDVQDQPADASATPAFWMPLGQYPLRRVFGIVRTAVDPLSLASAVQSAVHTIDRELPLADVRSMETIAEIALSERRFALGLCEAFALLALGLAAIGIYAMLTFNVGQRRHEIGIRLAMGASRRELVGRVTGHGLVLAMSGAAVGLFAAPLAGRLLSSLLYGVSPLDTVTLVVAPLIVATIAVVASLGPAWRAVRTDPMTVLRQP